MEVTAAIERLSVLGRTRERRGLLLRLRAFARNKLAVLGVISFLLLVVFALLAPIVAPADPIDMNLDRVLRPPERSHLFGTDAFGRDIFSRVIFGTRISLSVGFISMIVAVAAGVPLGLVSGYAGGTIDNILMRIVDALLSLPTLMLTIAIMGFLGPEVRNLILALSIVFTPTLARLGRACTLAMKEELYVTAARSVGATTLDIISRHILPNVIAPIVVQATIIVSWGIISEASLSFLGLGSQPPTPSWGQDLYQGRRYIGQADWMIVAPAMAIVVAVLSVNFIGDGLREALDPRAWKP